jgi:RHS repeat-associated protein
VWYGSSSYSEWDYFQSVAIQKDGQIVAAGTADGKFALARMNGGLTRLYVQQDANYNVTAVVDVSGNVKERADYTPFGVMTVLSPTWGSTSDAYAWQYTFQCGRYDPGTGMIRFGLRDYAAALGTWAEHDPAGYIDGPNRYAFAADSPEVLTDSTGLDWSVEKSRGNYWDTHKYNDQFVYRSPAPCTVVIGIKHWGDKDQDIWDVPDNYKYSSFGMLACLGDTINRVSDGGIDYGAQRGTIKNFPRMHSFIGWGPYDPAFSHDSMLQNGVVPAKWVKAFNLNNNASDYNGRFGPGAQGFQNLLDAAWDAAIAQAKELAKKAQKDDKCPCKSINIVVVPFESAGDDAWKSNMLSEFKNRKFHVDVADPNTVKRGLGH